MVGQEQHRNEALGAVLAPGGIGAAEPAAPSRPARPVRPAGRTVPLGLALVVPALLLMACAATGALLVSWITSGVAEVKAMGPWPAPGVPARQAAAVDLSHLGLHLQGTYDARENGWWAQGGYRDGALAVYELKGTAAANLWVLRYASSAAAGNDFMGAEAWAKGNCGAYRSAWLSVTGIIHCAAADGYNKTFWNDQWIVDIVAVDTSGSSPAALVDAVRDALAAHWREPAQP